MTILGDGLLILATVLGIPTILLLQFILGYKQVSSSTVKVVPVIYGLLLTFFTLTSGQLNTERLLFLGAQLLVAYFFYFVAEFGRTKSIEKVGKVGTEPADVHALAQDPEHK